MIFISAITAGIGVYLLEKYNIQSILLVAFMVLIVNIIAKIKKNYRLEYIKTSIAMVTVIFLLADIFRYPGLGVMVLGFMLFIVLLVVFNTKHYIDVLNKQYKHMKHNRELEKFSKKWDEISAQKLAQNIDDDIEDQEEIKSYKRFSIMVNTGNKDSVVTIIANNKDNALLMAEEQYGEENVYLF